MGSIYLIRHGQASFGQQNYDQLSELGYQQSILLGQWLKENVDVVDHVYSGSMQRHQKTAQGIMEAYGGTPCIEALNSVNEFNHEDMIHCYFPTPEEGKNSLKKLFRESPHPHRDFAKIFNLAFTRWTSGKNDEDYQESWPQFKERTYLGIQKVVKRAGASKNIFVITSGGPIATICQKLLSVPDEAAHKLNQNLANASVTKLLYNKDSIGIAYYNNYSPFEKISAKGLLTFR